MIPDGGSRFGPPRFWRPAPRELLTRVSARRVGPVLVAACVVGCGQAADEGNPSTEAHAPGVEIRTYSQGFPRDVEIDTATEIIRLGTEEGGNGTRWFGRIGGVGLLDNGWIAVLDYYSAEVSVWDGNEFKLAFGRPGQGPGELGRPRGLLVDQENRIWIRETGNLRYSQFGADGKFLRSVRIPPGARHNLWAARIDSAGGVVDVLVDGGPSTGRAEWVLSTVRVDLNGDVAKFPGEVVIPFNTLSGSVLPRPFGGRPAVAVGDGLIWYASTLDYRVMGVRRGDSSPSVAFLVEVEPEVVPAEERRQIAREWLEPEIIDLSEVPETRPKLGPVILISESYVGVFPQTDVIRVGTVMDLFSHQGAWLRRVHLPTRLDLSTPPVLADTMVIGVTVGHLDLPMVSAFRF